MLTEKSTYEEMDAMLRKCIRLALPKNLRDRLVRARLKGEKYIFYRMLVPGTRQPVLIIRNTDIKIFSPILVLDGREGEGYAFKTRYGITVIESHAIRRYFNRHEHMDEEDVKTLDDIDPDIVKRVVHRMLADMDVAVSVHDDFETAEECYYDGGVFLVNSTDKMAHFYSYVMNRQTFPDQRQRSLKSETNQRKKRAMLTPANAKLFARIDTAKAIAGL